MSNLALATVQEVAPTKGSKTRKPTKESNDRAAAKEYTEGQIRQLAGGLSVAILLPVLSLMGISLPHLASESDKILHCGGIVSWLTAFTFDVSQLVAEVILVYAATMKLKKAIEYRLWCIIGACSMVSWALNTLAFNREAADMLSRTMAFVFGALIPALILVLLYVSANLAKRWKGNI